MELKNSTGVDLYVVAVADVVCDGDSIELDDFNAVDSLTAQGWTLKAAKRTNKSNPADSADSQEV
ncbi:hypothetical protein UFOVP209_24 [uncultured Caudovirales phage]|uniref:Uncharacterized protein n=1 Tax=uncultured Caudovirales phage TaxID=2100421 RepID=A0A6J7WJD6_9CAUD|nr:hypothetical protein UFOVP209_24 [uncultured Caudovirales phage]